MALGVIQRRVGIALGLVVLAVPWYFVARTIENARPAAKSSVRANAVVWSDRVFSAPQPLGRWLHARGVAYSVWAARHPGGAAALGSESGALAVPKPSVGVDTAMRPPTRDTTEHRTASSSPVRPRATSGTAAPSNAGRRLVEIVVLLAALTLAALIAVRRGLPALGRPAWSSMTVERRVGAFAVAISVVAGVLVAHFMA
jgi:hypothetical protein